MIGPTKVCQDNSVCHEGPLEATCDCLPGYALTTVNEINYCRSMYIVKLLSIMEKKTL